MMAPKDNKTEITIRDLYPHLNEAELAEAEDNLERYLMLVLRIFERLELEENTRPTELTPAAGAIPCPVSESS
jgi:hypothetical protein